MDAVIIYSAQPGMGGLGMQAATAVQSLSVCANPMAAIGPPTARWPFAEAPPAIRWIPEVKIPGTARIFTGRAQYRSDSAFGQITLEHIRKLAPGRCYGFTQISREVAAWCRDHNVPFILDNPNGHLRNVRTVYQRESWRWFSIPYLGHPTEAMVDRVESEYSLATRIRVSSKFSKETMIQAGVPAEKIEVIPQFFDLARFKRSTSFPNPSGPLRVCFVGSLDLRKGFVYLLRAIRKIGPEKFTLRIVGNTGDPWCKRLLIREGRGLDLSLVPGDPVPTYHWAELCVTPSLEDGFGFVVAEAMASGVPVIVSDCCGAAEWVEHDTSGWILPWRTSRLTGGHNQTSAEDILAQYLQAALDDRNRLGDMGSAAFQAVRQSAEEKENVSLFADWFNAITLEAH